MCHQAEKRLFTAKEAAASLGISLYTLKKTECAGYLKPYHTLGGHRSYGQEMLEDYLEQSTRFSYKRAAPQRRALDSRPGSENGEVR